MRFAFFLAVTLPACGPSFQAIYEGNARFEHCYALEESPQVLMPEKASCWREWSEHYTYGQTRDRIHYATARFVALNEARALPTDEAMMNAAPGEAPRLSSITAPAPTSALEPPPKVLQTGQLKTSNLYSGDATNVPMTLLLDAGPALPVATVSASTSPPSPVACEDGCHTSLRDCNAGCGDVDGGSKGKCDRCVTSYRGCMKVCFR